MRVLVWIAALLLAPQAWAERCDAYRLAKNAHGAVNTSTYERAQMLQQRGDEEELKSLLHSGLVKVFMIGTGVCLVSDELGAKLVEVRRRGAEDEPSYWVDGAFLRKVN